MTRGAAVSIALATGAAVVASGAGATHADDAQLEQAPRRVMGGAMLSTELQLDPSGELWLGYGRFGEWVGSVQVSLFYSGDEDFFGYGVHGAYRLWPQVLGGKVFLEPFLGFASGQTNDARDSGFGLGLGFGYTFLTREHVALSAKAGFDIAPVWPRGYVGLELMLF